MWSRIKELAQIEQARKRERQSKMAKKKKAKAKSKPRVKATKKKIKKAAPKKITKRRLSLINLKVTGKDRKLLVELAAKHAGGNVSGWLRHAGLKYHPKRGEVIR